MPSKDKVWLGDNEGTAAEQLTWVGQRTFLIIKINPDWLVSCCTKIPQGED